MRLLKRWVPRFAERASKLISVVSCRKRSTCDSDRLLGQVYICEGAEGGGKGFPWRNGHQADGQNQVWPGGYIPARENTGSCRYQWCGWHVEVQESKVSDTAAGPAEIQGVERGYSAPEIPGPNPVFLYLTQTKAVYEVQALRVRAEFRPGKMMRQVRRLLCVHSIVQELPGRRRA